MLAGLSFVCTGPTHCPLVEMCPRDKSRAGCAGPVRSCVAPAAVEPCPEHPEGDAAPSGFRPAAASLCPTAQGLSLWRAMKEGACSALAGYAVLRRRLAPLKQGRRRPGLTPPMGTWVPPHKQ